MKTSQTAKKKFLKNLFITGAQKLKTLTDQDLRIDAHSVNRKKTNVMIHRSCHYASEVTTHCLS